MCLELKLHQLCSLVCHYVMVFTLCLSLSLYVCLSLSLSLLCALLFGLRKLLSHKGIKKVQTCRWDITELSQKRWCGKKDSTMIRTKFYIRKRRQSVLHHLLPTSLPVSSLNFNLRATKGGGGNHPLRFFRCHTICIWNRILTFKVAVGGTFAHI